jgi:FtsP/CotA-like multicopper oxidase with cupredoxin domain
MRAVYAFLLGFSVASTLCIPHNHPPNTASSIHQKNAGLLPSINTEKRNAGTPCAGNTANTRQEWCDYNIYTDYTTITPDTGVVCEFWFDLIQANLAPDGRERWTLTINGTIPGPTIIVNWGDTVVIHLRNRLPASLQNGTSLHFHGIRQLNTNPMDGVVSITQCPIAPGQTMTDRWRATQYGTTWYHSHIGLQTWEGVFGGVIINGPASANYDEDMGTILLNDWDVRTVDELWDAAQSSSPPTVDNALINGTNVFGEDGENQVGRRFEMSFRSGKSYRLRLENAACDTHYKFSIDHHVLTVIAADLVPVQPYTTTVLDIAIGKWTYIAIGDVNIPQSTF